MGVLLQGKLNNFDDFQANKYYRYIKSQFSDFYQCFQQFEEKDYLNNKNTIQGAINVQDNDNRR